MSGGSLNSQILYSWSGDSKPVVMGDGEAEKKLVAHADFMLAMRSSEEAMGQKILQDNQNWLRVAGLVTDGNLTSLDTGTATTAQIAAQVNSLITILNSLVSTGKSG